MFTHPINNHENRQWRMLLVYNFYRLISVVLFIGLNFYSPAYPHHFYLYSSIVLVYLMCGVLFFYFWRVKNLSFDKQVFLSGTIDVVAVSTLLRINEFNLFFFIHINNPRMQPLNDIFINSLHAR